MTTFLLAFEHRHTNWPEAAMVIALFAFMAVLFYLATRD